LAKEEKFLIKRNNLIKTLKILGLTASQGIWWIEECVNKQYNYLCKSDTFVKRNVRFDDIYNEQEIRRGILIPYIANTQMASAKFSRMIMESEPKRNTLLRALRYLEKHGY